jgi:hypothetical protein
MATMRKEEQGHPEHGREFFAIALDEHDYKALGAGHPVVIRVGLPPEREFHDTTFTISLVTSPTPAPAVPPQAP